MKVFFSGMVGGLGVVLAGISTQKPDAGGSSAPAVKVLETRWEERGVTGRGTLSVAMTLTGFDQDTFIQGVKLDALTANDGGNLVFSLGSYEVDVDGRRLLAVLPALRAPKEVGELRGQVTFMAVPRRMITGLFPLAPGVTLTQQGIAWQVRSISSDVEEVRVRVSYEGRLSASEPVSPSPLLVNEEGQYYPFLGGEVSGPKLEQKGWIDRTLRYRQRPGVARTYWLAPVKALPPIRFLQFQAEHVPVRAHRKTE